MSGTSMFSHGPSCLKREYRQSQHVDDAPLRSLLLPLRSEVDVDADLAASSVTRSYLYIFSVLPSSSGRTISIGVKG